MTTTHDKEQSLIAEAIDSFADATRFAKEAEHEVIKGNGSGVARFLALASEAAQRGDYAIRQLTSQRVNHAYHT